MEVITINIHMAIKEVIITTERIIENHNNGKDILWMIIKHKLLLKKGIFINQTNKNIIIKNNIKTIINNSIIHNK